MRPESLVNQIADAVVVALKRIDANQDAGRWFTVPTVRRGFLMADVIGGARPLLVVETSRYSQKPESCQNHRVELIVLVHCFSEGGLAAGDVELNRLVSDVLRAITDDEYLTKPDGSRLVGFISPEEYEPQTDIMERVGCGVATVACKVDFTWNHGAP